MTKVETTFISSQMSASVDRFEESETSEHVDVAFRTRRDMRRVIFEQFSERENQQILDDEPEIIVIPTRQAESHIISGGNKQKWRQDRSHRRVRFGQTSAPVVPVDREVEMSIGKEASEPEDPNSSFDRYSSKCESDGSSVHDDETHADMLHPRYRIIKQNECKYTAKLLIPASNPLYLGRFKTESAALDACKSALNRVTPRQEVDHRL